MRAGVDMHIAGAGGSVTHTLRARAVMVRKSAGAGRSGMKKTVPRRSLFESTFQTKQCCMVFNVLGLFSSRNIVALLNAFDLVD